MSTPERREVVDAEGCFRMVGPPMDRIDSFTATFAGTDVLFHHAPLMSIGEIDGRITIMVAQPGCGCGCGAPGRGLIAPIDAEQARSFAETLLGMVDRHEVEAATAAAAALAKAAGR